MRSMVLFLLLFIASFSQCWAEEPQAAAKTVEVKVVDSTGAEYASCLHGYLP